MSTQQPIALNYTVSKSTQARKVWSYYLIIVLVATTVFAALTPPFQAPDEFDHIKRAYMLSRGQIILNSVDGQPSGGYVDSGLISYMDTFNPLAGKAANKISGDELARAADMKWSGTEIRATPVGTAYYFPALYSPQALGLLIGKAAGMSVGHSYKIARLLTLLACVALLTIAFSIYTPPVPVLAALLLPMNLFLFSSAVLDPLATSSAVLAISAFLRLLEKPSERTGLVFWIFILATGLVAACRANMLPMLLMPFVLWLKNRDRRSAWAGVVLGVAVLSWTLFTIKSTVYPPGLRGNDTSGKLLGYLLDPLQFGQILWNTVSDLPTVQYYLSSFIGVLGWLDTPLPVWTYIIIASLFTLVSLLSIDLRSFDWPRAAMILITVSSTLLTFLALLVQWTVEPATKVDGVQGRYFLIPMLFLLYAVCGRGRTAQSLRHSLAIASTLALSIASVYASSGALVARYHTAIEQKANDQPVVGTLAVAAPLTTANPTELSLAPEIAESGSPIKEVGLLIGTYRATHSGKAALVLWTRDGKRIERTFELSSLQDNRYARIPVDPDHYVGGIVRSVDGEGISVYELAYGPASLSCLLGVTSDGRRIATAGCPAE